METADPRVRAARLRRLPAEGFVPPHAAAPDAAFAADVRAFAATFWSLPPAERRARWQELADRPVGAAAARLADLESGLGVAPVPQADPRAAELADLVRELFVLPPAARAARRTAWLTAADRRGLAWEGASRTVLRTDLPLARLDERLFDWFSRGDAPAPVAAVAESAAWVRRAPQAPEAVPPPEPAGGTGCLSGSGGLVIALIVVAKLLVAIMGTSRTPAPTYSPPTYSPQQGFGTPPVPDYGPPPPASNPYTPFTDQEVMRCLEYEDRKRAGLLRPSDRVPPRYGHWVDMGRPTRGTAP